MPAIGISLAIAALIAWGFGDRCIQLTTRKIGTVKALFFVGIVGFVMTSPFIRTADFTKVREDGYLAMIAAAVIVATVTALIEFQAFKLGKMAVVEPILGLELPLTVAIGVYFGHDILTIPEYAAIAVVFIGITAAATKNLNPRLTKEHLERGVLLAFIAAGGSALCNILIGLLSRGTSPFFAIWSIHGSVALICLPIIAAQGGFRAMRTEIKTYGREIMAQGVLDTVAWFCYAAAATRLPLSITAGISESYIALAALLGLTLGKEKVTRRQFFGSALAIVGVIWLSVLAA
jgi:drug/metabolite transporter (DMT)-like permease